MPGSLASDLITAECTGDRCPMEYYGSLGQLLHLWKITSNNPAPKHSHEDHLSLLWDLLMWLAATHWYCRRRADETGEDEAPKSQQPGDGE